MTVRNTELTMYSERHPSMQHHHSMPYYLPPGQRHQYGNAPAIHHSPYPPQARPVRVNQQLDYSRRPEIHHIPPSHPMCPPISIPPLRLAPNSKKRKLNNAHIQGISEVVALKNENSLLKRAYEAETKVLKLEKQQLETQLVAVQKELTETKSREEKLLQIKQKFVQLQENYNGLMANRNDLGKTYHSLKAENEVLKKRNDELLQKTQEYKGIIDGLRECSLHGPDADLSCLKFPIIKSEDSIKRTVDVQNLKESLKSNKMIHKHRHRGYADELILYLDANKNDDAKYLNPMTSIKKRLNDMTEKFKIESHRSEALIGQYGLKATQNIPNNAILGRLTGLECTAEEWERAFIGTNCYEKNMKYLCQFEAGKGKNKLNVIIDPIAAKLDAFGPLYINDCR